MAEFPIKKELVYVFWAKKDSTGVYPYGSDGAISNGTIEMMARARAFNSFSVNQAVPAQKTLLADGGVFHSYRPQPTEPVTGEMGFLALDQDLRKQAMGLVAYTEGQHSIQLMINNCFDYGKLCLVLNFKADIYDDSTGVVTPNKWWVEEYLDVEVFPQQNGGSGNPNDDVQPWVYATLFKEPSKTLYGATITNNDYGATKAFGRQYSSDNPVIYGTIVGNNSLDSYTIPSAYDPVGAAATYIQCWDDGTAQTYGSSAGNFELNASDNQVIDFATAPGTGSIHVFKLEFNGGGC
jgi:hypothetical protein